MVPTLVDSSNRSILSKIVYDVCDSHATTRLCDNKINSSYHIVARFIITTSNGLYVYRGL